METPLAKQLPLTDDDTLHRWEEAGIAYQIFPRFFGTECGWPLLWGPKGQEVLRECVRLRRKNDRLEAALRVLIPLCLDALREAEGISEEELFDQLQKAELIELTIFDPERHGEIEGAEPGAEIWVLTDLGKEFAEAKEG